MSPGDVILISFPQIGSGAPKLRPALVLADLPGPYQSLLICGISTQLHHQESDWDELVVTSDPEFHQTGLHRDSIVRLSYLYSADAKEIAGVIGRLGKARIKRLLQHLSEHLIHSI